MKGFESSKAHDMLIEMLKENDFNYQEYLICPRQIGIPNARLRYYLIASKFPGLVQKFITDVQNIDETISKHFSTKDSCLKSYVNDENDPFHKESLGLLSKILVKHAHVFDIVNEDSKNTCCFTKSYGKYAEGTGKILKLKGPFV